MKSFLLEAIAILLLSAGNLLGQTSSEENKPVVFWASDGVGPGDCVLLYGGGLADVRQLQAWRCPDGAESAAVAVRKVYQPCDGSLKFLLPSDWKPGMYAVKVAGGEPVLLNRPKVWFLQPEQLQPGLDANQAPPGAKVQIVGKDFLLPGGEGKPQIELRAADGRQSRMVAANQIKHAEGLSVNATVPNLAPGRYRVHIFPGERGKAMVEFRADLEPRVLAPERAEKFSLRATLPANLAPGSYQLRVSNGFGGAAGWSEPLTVEIKQADVWPSTAFNVREFGAKGDDMTDDTAAVRKALAAAEANGGGVVFFPWGTYRLNDWIFIPERTTVRGEGRESTLLKWPVGKPNSPDDFQKAAVYASARYAIEDLTLVARRVDMILCDTSMELNYGRTIPPELLAKLRPWGQSRDKFLRRVRFQHWLLVGRPEKHLEMAKKYVPADVWNFRSNELRNCEVSDCVFQGAGQFFANLVNGRIVRNSFSNQLGPCWTILGGGAIDLVCEGNDLRCVSTFGWGWTGMQRVYSAHNRSWNFERGEREAMTCDVSGLPTARPVSQHWGPCAEAGTRDGKAFLRFEGVRWTPECFAGGAAIVRAARQMQRITGNTADTVYLEHPLSLPDKSAVIEIAPRHHRAHVGTSTWIGRLKESRPAELVGDDAHWIPQEFVGMTAVVLDGKGAGQYRVITSNTADRATLERPWDVVPDRSSAVGVWSLLRHMIVYDCRGEDTSAFAQLYGSFYDYIVDSCRVERTQGIWGQMGWFVQFRDNTVKFANSYHDRISMAGPNPECCAPFGLTGLVTGSLRITKAGSCQYPDRKLPLFVDDVLGQPVPSTLGLTLRGNRLSYGHRLVVEPWTGDKVPGPRPPDRFRDVIVDGNQIEHSAVGIQLGPDVAGAIMVRNRFEDVAQPLLEAVPGKSMAVAE